MERHLFPRPPTGCPSVGGAHPRGPLDRGQAQAGPFHCRGISGCQQRQLALSSSNRREVDLLTLLDSGSLGE
eukprot:3315835-Pyramimonas_sp.AAC.1